MRLSILIFFCLFFADTPHLFSQTASLTRSGNFHTVHSEDSVPPLKSKVPDPDFVTVDYQFHPGKCQLQNGETLQGWFCFFSYAQKFNLFFGQKMKRKDEMLFKATENSLPDTIRLDKIDRLALAGKDSSVYTMGDSTIFIFSYNNDKLLRLRSEKPVRIYDDLPVVDELFNHKLTFWCESVESNIQRSSHTGIMYGNTTLYYCRAKPIWEWVDTGTYRQLRTTEELFYEWKGALMRITNWKGLKGMFTIDPYILKVAEIFHRNSPSDVAFGILFSYSENKLSLLPFFREIEIRLLNGQTLKGSGFIQPYRTGWYGKPSCVHFFDGKNFSLFFPEEILSISYLNRKYQPVFDSYGKSWYLGFSYEFDNKTYCVAEGHSPPGKSGFFNQDGEPVFLIFSQKKNGKYFLENDKDLWNAFNKDMTGGGSR
jgi:hypothetical protein